LDFILNTKIFKRKFKGCCFVQEIDQTDLWITLSSKLDNGKMSSALREGDEMKMGRILFKVLQVIIFSNKSQIFCFCFVLFL